MRRLVLAPLLAGLLALAGAAAAGAGPQAVRLKDLGRFQGAHDGMLVGYGVVLGLSGSGDSPRNPVTQQALANVLGRFGANIPADQVRSRNVAVVMVSATLPPAAKAGDRLDVTVASLGDARSLHGGALLVTPLTGGDGRAYAVAQGSVVVGGFRFDADQNVEQRNHPTSGQVPGGAVVQADTRALARGADGSLVFVLDDADATTAARVADALERAFGAGAARVQDAKSVRLSAAGDPTRLIARAESISISPDLAARVVVNERSGTVVAGAGVQISGAVISQGGVRVSVTVDNTAAQPTPYGGYAPELRSLIVTNTRLEAAERRDAVVRLPNTTVADLVDALARVNVRTREMIAILQALKAAGALHADIVVQ